MKLYCKRGEPMQRENIVFNTPSLPINIKNMPTKKAEFYRDMHFHNAVELVYINDGEMLCRINDEIFELSSGNIILINNGVIHKLANKNKANITYVHIDIDDFLEGLNVGRESQIYNFIKSANAKDYFISRGDSELLMIYKKIMEEIDNKKRGYEIYVKSYITSLVGFMYRNRLLMEYKEFCNIKKLHEIMPSLYYIDENFSSKLTLAEIAEKSNCDKYNFCRLFKNATGTTAFEYINFVRIKNAEKQLISTEKAISEIAFDCGFASVQYFNRAFKKYRGCTPRTYQKYYSKFLV